MNDRARGALVGLAVGDALGTTYEFAAIEQPAYPTLATGPATDVVGGGPFELAAGQVTDDTQMAVCLARSLGERGRLEVDDVAARYVAWSAEAFDIGFQTRTALAAIERGEPAHRAGFAIWRDGGHRAAGNGSLMRTTPLAVIHGTRAELVDAALEEAMITHADPRCALACAAFDVAVLDLIAGGAHDVLDGMERTLDVAAERLALIYGRLGARPDEHALIHRARAELATDVAAARSPDPGVYGEALHVHRTAGFVRVALRLAFWHVVHTPSWRDAVVDVASRGGDADTNAAIVGALLGARDGAAAIPQAWSERVLGATQRGSSTWAEAHHPRHLLALVR